MEYLIRIKKEVFFKLLNFIDITNKEILSYLSKDSEPLLTINTQEFKDFSYCPENLSIIYYKTTLLEEDLNKNNYFGIYPQNPNNIYLPSNKLFFYKQFDSVQILWHTITYKSNLLYFIIDSIIPNETYSRSPDPNYDYMIGLSSLTYQLNKLFEKRQCSIIITGVWQSYAQEDDRETIEKRDDFIGSSDTAFILTDDKGREYKYFYYIVKYESKVVDFASFQYSIYSHFFPSRSYPYTLGIETGGGIPNIYFMAARENIISSYDDLDNNIRLDQLKRYNPPPYKEGQHIYDVNLPPPSDILGDYPLIKKN